MTTSLSVGKSHFLTGSDVILEIRNLRFENIGFYSDVTLSLDSVSSGRNKIGFSNRK